MGNITVFSKDGHHYVPTRSCLSVEMRLAGRLKLVIEEYGRGKVRIKMNPGCVIKPVSDGEIEIRTR